MILAALLACCLSISPDVTVSLDATNEIALPAHSVALFEASTDMESDPLEILWRRTAGPLTATLTGTRSQAALAQFDEPGRYEFQFSATDGVHTTVKAIKVTVYDAATQTEFYVDPDYSGGMSDGSAAMPWVSLATAADGGAEWNAINAACATNHTVVYYPARAASADIAPTPETVGLHIYKTCASGKRLTVDGMSKYNANNATPDWQTYNGARRFPFVIASGALAIGIESDQISWPMDNVTLRGFDITGSRARTLLVGNELVAEYIYSHDTVDLDPQVLFMNAVYPTCDPWWGNKHNILIHGNTLTNGFGEAIYIGGNYTRVDDGGCLSWLTTHYDILIEDNSITDPAANGGQADGIDMKEGLRHVTLRGNTIRTTDMGAIIIATEGRAIVSSGLINSTSPQDMLWENNELIWGVTVSIQQTNTMTFRNNIMSNTGLVTDQSASQRNIDVSLLNNTLAPGYFYILVTDGITVKNNILATGGVMETHGFSTGLSSDYNAINNTVSFSNWSEGGNSIISSSIVNSIFVDAMAEDFHLDPGSPPVQTGVVLDPIFPDKDGLPRPRTGAWDMGAYEIQ